MNPAKPIETLFYTAGGEYKGTAYYPIGEPLSFLRKYGEIPCELYSLDFDQEIAYFKETTPKFCLPEIEEKYKEAKINPYQCVTIRFHGWKAILGSVLGRFMERESQDGYTREDIRSAEESIIYCLHSSEISSSNAGRRTAEEIIAYIQEQVAAFERQHSYTHTDLQTTKRKALRHNEHK